MLFRDRLQAANLLATKLAHYKDRHPIILGVPRGAVPMAQVIADALDGELDVVLVRKLGAPGQPELAIGAVDETGEAYLNPYVRELGVSHHYIDSEIADQLAILRHRRSTYTPFRPPINPAGRIAIVVDDGSATGSTLVTALRSVRAKRPAQLVAAIGVASSSALRLITPQADEVVCLDVPEQFFAVGEFFADFSPVTDEQVAEILRQVSAKSAPAR
jgi:predicted phosphoribosyltransferase